MITFQLLFSKEDYEETHCKDETLISRLCSITGRKYFHLAFKAAKTGNPLCNENSLASLKQWQKVHLSLKALYTYFKVHMIETFARKTEEQTCRT